MGNNDDGENHVFRIAFIFCKHLNSPAKVACWPDYCFLQASPQELTYCFEGRGFGKRLRS